MEYDLIVLESPQPLENGGKGQNKVYFIATGIGALVGILILIFNGVGFGMGYLLIGVMFGVMGLLIGWGIKNKIVKYKCSVLERMRFLADEKLSTQELYQRLLPISNSLQLQMFQNEEGNLSFFYKGLYYDIIFNEDNSFSIRWHRSLVRAIASRGYFLSVYKKILTGMGLIGYYVQRVCMTENENYYINEADRKK